MDGPAAPEGTDATRAPGGTEDEMRRSRQSRRPWLVLAALTACAHAGTGTPPAPACELPRDAARIQDEIRALEQRGARANVEGWSEAEARGFFADDWVSVSPDGKVNGLDTVWSGFRDGQSQPWAGRFDLLELDIRPGCDVTVVIGLAEAARVGAPDGEKPTRFRYLNVWRRTGQRWRYAASQFTRY